MVFMDGSNIFWGRKYYCTQNNTNLKIDYKKLLDYVVGARTLVRAIYYTSQPVPLTSSGQQGFYTYLRGIGIQVISKELKVRSDGAGGQKSVEKGVDVALATDLLGMAWENAYDNAVLISGDADYVGAVSKVMSKGKNVEVVSFRGSCSAELKNSGVKTIYIDDFAQLIRIP